MKKWKYSDTTPTLEFEEYYQEGAGTENVGPFLYSLIRMIRPRKVLEIGFGYTTPFILKALEENLTVLFDANSEPEYFKKEYKPTLTTIDNLSESYPNKSSIDVIKKLKADNNIDWIFHQKDFQGLATEIPQQDFVWFDCGGPEEYEAFTKEYWPMCSEYILFHFTYFKGKPSPSLGNILNNISGKYFRMDIIEPNKYRQGSLTMFRKL